MIRFTVGFRGLVLYTSEGRRGARCRPVFHFLLGFVIHIGFVSSRIAYYPLCLPISV